MYAVEFQAKVKNGTIEIPAQYRDRLKQIVRVIVLAEANERPSNLIDQLLETPLHVKDFKPFSRDEIYARS
ncbi:MAG: hypothetical protein HY870_19510 [Chloroflexi bacterium]|nr:hypothetical protein [Chloroflexota bacterium]